MVFGVVIPLTPNSAPVKEITETVRSAVPTFEIVSVELLAEPIATVPSCSEELLREICGAGLNAVADRFTVTGELPLSPCAVMVPVTVPAVVGVTATVMFADWPVARAIGNTAPGNENCEFEMLTWVMETLVLPVLVTATVCVVCLPTPTFPKLMLAGLRWNAACICVWTPLT